MIEANTESELQEIKAKVEKAQKWALEYFNAKQAGDPRMVDDNLEFIKAFFVEFPAPDLMRVSPSIMGTPSVIWFEYRLHFKKDGRLAWQGYHPFWGTPVGPLWIEA